MSGIGKNWAQLKKKIWKKKRKYFEKEVVRELRRGNTVGGMVKMINGKMAVTFASLSSMSGICPLTELFVLYW